VIVTSHRHKDQVARVGNKEDAEVEASTAFKETANRPHADPRMQMRSAERSLKLSHSLTNSVLLMRG
jgi:hypothetical protein